MLLPFFAVLVSLSCASEAAPRERPFLLARDKTTGPLSPTNPYAVISYDVMKDVNTAHFKQASDMLNEDLELILISDFVSLGIDESVLVKLVSEVKVADDDIDLAFHASLFVMGHPMIMFSRQPEDRGYVTRSYYSICKSGDEECLQIYARTGIRDNQYTIAYESDKRKRCFKTASCSQSSHIELFKKTYNVRMDEPAYIDQAFSFCFYVTALMEKESNEVLTVLLLDQDSPACLWDIVKGFITKNDRFQTVTRILIKKFPGHDDYRLIIRLFEKPSNETLEQIRSIVRPYLGPCSNFEELAMDESDDCKINIYEAFRFNYSELFLSALTYTNNEKNCAAVYDEASFIQEFMKTKREIGFRLARYFPEMDTKVPFHCAIKCPYIQPRHLFKQLAKKLFFPGNRWTDCLSRIEIRTDAGILMFHAYYYMLTDWELKMAHKVLSNAVERVYQDMTGGVTFVSGGKITTREDPNPIKAPKIAEAPTPARETDSSSRIKPSSTKKTSKKRKARKSRIKPCFAEVACTPATVPSKIMLLDIEIFEAIVHVSEHFGEAEKPSVRPGSMTDLQSWIFDLPDDDFDFMLSCFADRLNSSN